ncbi:hypothetical protein RB653_005557 [Dictyostelium firmibasis]|uniref:Cationic amino acid transporter C-terminal domain-containing protein n=1 Tax=Dictyostelium firmibasis TaxID=79012 RepID=A0AAN7YYA0_9MYCE
MGNLSNYFNDFVQTSRRKKSVYQLRLELATDEISTSDPSPSTDTNDTSMKNADLFNLENQSSTLNGSTSSVSITNSGGAKGFKKCLNVTDLLAFGVGSIIGAGIFVLTGYAAHEKAGPAIIVSYLVAGICCGLSGLCYAEFASRIPCSGSTYSYSYIMVGELVAWIVGWDLTLEYMIASASVGRGWSGYLSSIITSGGGKLPKPIAPVYLADGFSLDIIAFLSIMVLTIIIAMGMKESARFNKIFVVIKVAVIIFVIVLGGVYADTSNWDNFAPYGAKGIFNAAAITFFAYLGFDGVCNVAEEVENPQRDLPIGILGSLGISTVLYIGTAGVLTLLVPYQLIDNEAPLSVAFENIGLKWASIIVAIGAFAGLTTAQLGGLISQPRLYYSLSRDGLLPKWFGKIHPRFKTPFNATMFTGVCCATISLFVNIDVLADMVSIGTLLSFTLVSTCVLILRYPAPNTISESTARYPVNKFPKFLQSSATLVPIIVIFAAITSLGYVKSLHWAIILVFGFIGVLFSAIPFFFTETPETILSSSKKTFLCPLVPFIPILSIWANMYLMVSLSWGTWVRLIVWLIIGLIIYVFYGRKNSKLGKEQQIPQDNFVPMMEMDQLEKKTLGNSTSSSSSSSSNNENNLDDNDDNSSGNSSGEIPLASSGVTGDTFPEDPNNEVSNKKSERQPLSPAIKSTTPKQKTPSSLSPSTISPRIKQTISNIKDHFDLNSNNNSHNNNNNKFETLDSSESDD